MEPDPQLESLMDRELKRLAPPHAPATLMTRVMAQVHARVSQPWYRQSWFHWPTPWRVAVGGAALVILGLMVWGAYLWVPDAVLMAETGGAWLRQTATALVFGMMPETSGILPWLRMGQPVLAGLAMGVGGLVLASAILAGTCGLIVRRARIRS